MYDRLTLRSVNLLEYEVSDDDELKQMYFNDSKFVARNAIPLRPGKERVEILDPPMSVRHIERFFKYVEIARIVSLFVETMVDIFGDSIQQKHSHNDGISDREYRTSNLARILASGGETLAEIVGSSPQVLIGIIQVASTYEFDRLRKLAIQCMAVLLSVPNETKWSSDDENVVWSSLNRFDKIELRNILYGLSWYMNPDALRFRAVRDLFRNWKDDLVEPSCRCLDEALSYLLRTKSLGEEEEKENSILTSNMISTQDPLQRAYAISRIASSLAIEEKEKTKKTRPSFVDQRRESIEKMQSRLHRDISSSSSPRPILTSRQVEKENTSDELKKTTPKSLLLRRVKRKIEEQRRKNDDEEEEDESVISEKDSEIRNQPKSLLLLKPRSRLNSLARPRGPIMKKKDSSRRAIWR